MRNRRPLRTGARLALIVPGLLALAVGCVTPITYQSYRPMPVETARARVELREVRRGYRGCQVTLAITNLSSEPLERIDRSRVQWSNNSVQWQAALDRVRLLESAERFGPAAMGIDDLAGWFEASTALDSPPPLATGEERLLTVALAIIPKHGSITLNVAPALQWRLANGDLLNPAEPILLAVELPSVPAIPRTAWGRNVHFGVSVSSDDF